MKFIFVVLAVILTICYAQRTPTISYITPDQTKDIGGTVELDCSSQYARDYSIVWIKRDRNPEGSSIFLSTGSSLVIKDSRFSLRYDGASSTYTLLIRDIQESDAGLYQCEIILSINNKITSEVYLAVRSPPVISDNSTQSIVISEGKPVALECYANGFPRPQIHWRRENNALLPTGGSVYSGNILKITAVNKEDRGTYYCVATNGLGRGDRRHINLEVEFEPVISSFRPRVGQALGYDADLECHIEAYPPPQIIWVKDDIIITNNQHHSISQLQPNDESTDSTVRIITVEQRQYGTYTCKASNKLGYAEARIELFETKNPVCPPACSKTG